MAEEGVSLEAQLSKCQQYAQLQDLEVVGTYTDEGKTGKNTNRDGLREALKSVKKHKGTLIIVSLSRLSRSVVDTCQLVEELNKTGANLASVQENISTEGACGRFVLNVMSSLYQMEVEQLSERTKNAMQHLRNTRRRFSRHAPYGYRYEEGKMVEDDAEQHIIRYIHDLRKEGLTQTKIAEILAANGFNNRVGKPITQHAVSKVLRAG